MATSSPLPCLIAEWNRRGGLVNDGGHISISSGPQLLSSQHSGGAVVPRAAAEQATSTQQDRATTDSVRCQRRASQALRACLHHSRLFPALDVIAISSPAPLSDTCSRCEPAGRVHLEANCTTSASRQISGSRRQQSAGSYPLRGCLLTLTYSSGASSWRMLHSGRLSLCAPNGGRQAPAIFHTGSMQLRSGTLICSAGSVLVSQGGHSSVASRCPCWP
jgi:hypothetical protein